MKHADLSLDTVYADRDGLPVVLVSLDKYRKPRQGYGNTRIRPYQPNDKSVGVLTVRRHGLAKEVTIEDLLARRLGCETTSPSSSQPPPQSTSR